jgi:hypothetical protein
VRSWLGRPVDLEALREVVALGAGKPARYSSALDIA